MMEGTIFFGSKTEKGYKLFFLYGQQLWSRRIVGRVVGLVSEWVGG